MHFILIIKLLVIINIFLNQYLVNGETIRTTADRIRNFGYTSETHSLTTKDGYIIQHFRITSSPNSKTANTVRPVVLIWHGLVSSSDGWVLPGPQKALAFNLFDSGYDVWLANARGNTYGLRHVSLSTSDRRFWQFSWHEIGIYDLPLTIDYILQETVQSSLHYVGHSQGTAIMFVLLSTQPSYNRKIKSAHMLAPIAYMKYARSPLIQGGSPFVGNYNFLDPILGDLPLLQQPILRTLLGVERCRSPYENPDFCAFLLFTISGGASGYFNKTLLPEIFDTHPASASTHQAIHLIQLHVSGRFCQYDFGYEGNLKRYNRPTPPDYKLSNINTRFPLHLYFSDYDELSSKTDSENLSRALGNKTVDHFIDLPQYAHIDFIWGTNVKEVINEGILKIMNEVESLLGDKR